MEFAILDMTVYNGFPAIFEFRAVRRTSSPYCACVMDWFDVLCMCHGLVRCTVHVSWTGPPYWASVIDWFAVLCMCHGLVRRTVHVSWTGSPHCAYVMHGLPYWFAVLCMCHG